MYNTSYHLPVRMSTRDTSQKGIDMPPQVKQPHQPDPCCALLAWTLSFYVVIVCRHMKNLIAKRRCKQPAAKNLNLHIANLPPSSAWIALLAHCRIAENLYLTAKIQIFSTYHFLPELIRFVIWIFDSMTKRSLIWFWVGGLWQPFATSITSQSSILSLHGSKLNWILG